MSKSTSQSAPHLVLPVTADGAVATVGVGGGRLVPVVMVDMTGHAELRELFHLHAAGQVGDCISGWSADSLKQTRALMLTLAFTKPLDLVLGITFELPRRAGLVDQILAARGMYLQQGLPRDRMSTTQDHPRILIELPPTGFEEPWDKMFPAVLAAELQRSGLAKRAAREGARDMVGRWRRFGSIRIPSD